MSSAAKSNLSLLEGEQPGFRRAANIKRALDGELYFYPRVFGFKLADVVAPIIVGKSLKVYFKGEPEKSVAGKFKVGH